MPALHKNRVKMTVTSAPGTSSPVTLVAASTGHQSFATAYGANATVDVLISNGTDWEVQRGVTYTHSGTTVSRGTPEASSNSGSLVNFSSATNLTVEEIATAGFGNDVETMKQTAISGLQISYVSSSSISVSPGHAYIESLGLVLVSTSAISVTGLSSLTASTLYYVYLYSNSGVAAVEVSTTAPASSAYRSNARSKTSDTSRRFIGCFYTSSAGSNNVPEFVSTAIGESMKYYFPSPPRKVNGVGATASFTQITLSECPANVTINAAFLLSAGISSGSNISVGIGLSPTSTAANPVSYGEAVILNTSSYWSQTHLAPVAPATPAIWWRNNGATNPLTYIDLTGFEVVR